ncbi:fimbrial assembly protein FimA [Glycomyces fuscus]|nr:fimbrial assembly protein FimA [Glycomyces fuscus]
MTFSIAAHQDGRFGIAAASSSPAVAARVVHLRDSVGAVASQNITDPRLGTVLLDRLAGGASPRAALDAVAGGEPDIAYRQLTVVDASGAAATFSGSLTLGVHGEATGPHCAAAGNMLSDPGVPAAMCESFASARGELEERLLAALTAGLAAGGEAGPVYSAGLSTVSANGWRDTDLRVDWQENPVEALGGLLGVWLPQRDDYVRRGLEPAASPGYGVPGDDR